MSLRLQEGRRAARIVLCAARNGFCGHALERRRFEIMRSAAAVPRCDSLPSSRERRRRRRAALFFDGIGERVSGWRSPHRNRWQSVRLSDSSGPKRTRPIHLQQPFSLRMVARRSSGYPTVIGMVPLAIHADPRKIRPPWSAAPSSASRRAERSDRRHHERKTPAS